MVYTEQLSNLDENVCNCLLSVSLSHNLKAVTDSQTLSCAFAGHVLILVTQSYSFQLHVIKHLDFYSHLHKI